MRSSRFRAHTCCLVCCNLLKTLKQRHNSHDGSCKKPSPRERNGLTWGVVGNVLPLMFSPLLSEMKNQGGAEQVLVCARRERGWIEYQPARLPSWGSMAALRDERCSTLLFSSLKYSWPSFFFFLIFIHRNTNNTTWVAMFIGLLVCVFCEAGKSYICEHPYPKCGLGL